MSAAWVSSAHSRKVGTARASLQAYGSAPMASGAADVRARSSATASQNWRTSTLLALRRGARAWPPLRRLLNDAAPDQLRLTDDEAFDLLGDATDALRVAGVDVHWHRSSDELRPCRVQMTQCPLSKVWARLSRALKAR
ncbi:hypothetical protein [Streptomyces sp. NPDC003032]